MNNINPLPNKILGLKKIEIINNEKLQELSEKISRLLMEINVLENQYKIDSKKLYAKEKLPDIVLRLYLVLEKVLIFLLIKKQSDSDKLQFLSQTIEDKKTDHAKAEESYLLLQNINIGLRETIVQLQQPQLKNRSD